MNEPADPDVIARDITETRQRMAADADALAAKLDVPARARERVLDVVPDMPPSASGAASGALAWAREHPVPVAAAVVAAVFLLGRVSRR